VGHALGDSLGSMEVSMDNSRFIKPSFYAKLGKDFKEFALNNPHLLLYVKEALKKTLMKCWLKNLKFNLKK